MKSNLSALMTCLPFGVRPSPAYPINSGHQMVIGINKWVRLLGTVLAGYLLAGVTAQAQTQNQNQNQTQAQTQAQASAVVVTPHVVTEHALVHSKALEGNLEGNPADRNVIIYLPVGYKSHPKSRYPVVYALHGYSIDNEKWTTEIKTPQTIDGAFVGGVKDMIVVLPDSRSVHNGSMYANSVTTGDFEDFIVHDLIAYIDSHYRTLAKRESRGLVGHSMGGYGTIKLGMKHPEVFGALYVMSPCCLSVRGAPPPEIGSQLEALDSVEASKTLGFFQRAILASASAWSPNPKKPPFYVDLPTHNGQPDPDVLARWTANSPLAMIHQYIPNMRQYKAIAFDVGNRDGLKTDTQALHETLEGYGIANSFELYDGDHVSGVADRFQNHVLPFFDKVLSFEPSK